MADEIIKELWKIKDAIAQEYGYDVKSLVAHLRGTKHEEDNRIVDLRSMKQAAKHKVEADVRARGAAGSESSAGAA